MNVKETLDRIRRNHGKSTVPSGVSLAEIAITIAIFAIISLAVNSLFSAAFEAQLTQRGSALVESIALDFSETFRTDSRSAVWVSVGGANSITGTDGSGNTIQFFYDLSDNTRSVTYTVNANAGTLTRVATVDPRTHNSIPQQQTVFVSPTLPRTQNLLAMCQRFDANNQVTATQAPCFTFIKRGQQNNAQAQDVRVTVNGIRITAPSNQSLVAQGIMLPVDSFGQPGFNIRSISYSIAGSRVFR